MGDELNELEDIDTDLETETPAPTVKSPGRKSAIQIDFPDTLEACLAMKEQEKDPKIKMKIRSHLRKKHNYYISKNRPEKPAKKDPEEEITE